MIPVSTFPSGFRSQSTETERAGTLVGEVAMWKWFRRNYTHISLLQVFPSFRYRKRKNTRREEIYEAGSQKYIKKFKVERIFDTVFIYVSMSCSFDSLRQEPSYYAKFQERKSSDGLQNHPRTSCKPPPSNCYDSFSESRFTHHWFFWLIFLIKRLMNEVLIESNKNIIRHYHFYAC